MKEALFYTQKEDKVVCNLCPASCNLKNNETGKCRTRININNKLYTKAYGNLCALHIDPIEKKPLYHFLPGAKALSLAMEGCNFSCLNCQNFTISQNTPPNRLQLVLPEDIVNTAKKEKCETIAYTYTEPIVFYEYMLETAQLAKKAGIKNILISNGYIQNEPLQLLTNYLDGANINLKSFDPEIHKKLTGGNLNPVLNTLKSLKTRNVWLEITNLIVPDFTDDFVMIENMCTWLMDNGFENTPLHFSKFHPMYKLQNSKSTPFDTLLKAYTIAKKCGLNYVYIGNCGAIEQENTFCPKCNALLINRSIFSVSANKIKNACCTACNNKINGVW